MDLRTLNIVLVGMVVVYVVLTLLIFCIKIYSAIISKFSNRKNNSDNNGNPGKEVVETTSVNSNSTNHGLSPELIAVITAAIAASMGGSGTGLKVRSIKRIGHTTPIWNVAGRSEYILTRL
ncbi:MAG: oxaloacetate decarboxylase, gamma chain [Clostridiaceae bacterium]|nr:oxaloacetate decarboxylase, gamma chain [Clostridiaceae bacterium]